jgi:hypothetical protein
MHLGTCPSCSFLVPPEQATCRFCGADTQPDDSWVQPFAVPPERGRPWWVALAPAIIAGAAVVAVMAIVAAFTVVGHGQYPERWDRRVAPLAAFVAAERGLEFRHPVHVDFVDPATFRADLKRDESELTAEDREELDQSSGLLRALGMLDAGTDLFDSVNTASSEGTLAYYDPETERVTVRGTKLTPAVEVTLVHELTHVLQDQHFDLQRLQHLSEEDGGNVEDALVEGDANRVASAYEESLPDTERDQVDEASQRDAEDATDDGVPPAIIALFGAPYALGEPFTQTIVAAEGQEGLDEALRRPPTSEEQLYDPWTYLAGDEAADVRAPKLAPGDRKVDDGPFGALGWYMMLAQRIDARQALDAVDGWDGDAYVAFERDGRACVRIAYQGETSGDTDQLAAAVNTWFDSMPAGAGEVRVEGTALEFEACDPGKAAALPKDVGATDLIGLPVMRSVVAAGVLEDGMSRPVAECYSNGIVRAFTDAELQAEELTPEMEGRLRDLAVGCVSEGRG